MPARSQAFRLRLDPRPQLAATIALLQELLLQELLLDPRWDCRTALLLAMMSLSFALSCQPGGCRQVLDDAAE
jgi:hypothetical protein